MWARACAMETDDPPSVEFLRVLGETLEEILEGGVARAAEGFDAGDAAKGDGRSLRRAETLATRLEESNAWLHAPMPKWGSPGLGRGPQAEARERDSGRISSPCSRETSEVSEPRGEAKRFFYLLVYETRGDEGFGEKRSHRFVRIISSYVTYQHASVARVVRPESRDRTSRGRRGARSASSPSREKNLLSPRAGKKESCRFFPTSSLTPRARAAGAAGASPRRLRPRAPPPPAPRRRRAPARAPAPAPGWARPSPRGSPPMRGP